MSRRQGPPKHQNRFAWKPNAGNKINETEPGGKFRPLSEITGVCARCKEQIDWKRRYGKYKPLTEPAKCQRCSKRNVRQAYHNLCSGCAKEHNVCAKCCSRVDRIIGRDSSEVEAEQKMLEEAIKHARERDRRTLLRAMNTGKSKSSTKTTTNKETVGDLFPNASLEDYAKSSRNDHFDHDNHNDVDDEDNEDDDEYDSEDHDHDHCDNDDGEEEDDDDNNYEDSVHDHDDMKDGCKDRDKKQQSN